MAVVGSAIMDQDCIQFIDEWSLFEVVFDQLLVFGLKFDKLFLFLLFKLGRFSHFLYQF